MSRQRFLDVPPPHLFRTLEKGARHGGLGAVVAWRRGGRRVRFEWRRCIPGRRQHSNS